MIPANSVYPQGVPSAGITTATFDANPDGSINQAAFNSRWVNQGSNQTNDAYSGNLDWVDPADVLRQRFGRLVPDR